MNPAPASQEVQQIPITALQPSPANPRKSIDPVFLAQLADSIKQLGVQVPLLVRKAPGNAVNTNPKRFEIIAGHRRYFAALELSNLATLPCIVREMSDGEAREIMLVENLQREDLPALEEAEAYEELQRALGTVASVAARVGKPIDYVTRRLKLLTLILFSRDALRERLITLDHALLLAKLPDAEQETALRFTLEPNVARKVKTGDLITSAVKFRADEDRWRYWEPESVLKLKDFIEHEIKLELKRAPWDLADAALVPSAGACAGCAKNTAENTALFGDLAVEDARCTDSACFAAKRAAFVQAQIEAVKAAGADAVRVSWKSTTSKPRALDDLHEKKYLAQTFKAGQWIEAKKGACSFLHAGVTVDFDEPTYGSPDLKKKPGMRLLVCVAATCKVHRKAWQEKKREDGPRNENTAEARAAREQRAEAVKVENAIRAALVRQAIPRITTLSGELLRRVVLKALPNYMGDHSDRFPGLEDSLRKAKVDSSEFARAAASLLFVGDDDFAVFPDEWQLPEAGRKEFLALLKDVFGVDGRKAWQEKPAKSSPKSPANHPGGKNKPQGTPAKPTAKKPASSPAKKKAAKKGGKR